MNAEVKTMQINIEKDKVLDVQYFTSDISEKPNVAEVILRFDDPKTGKNCQISQREFKDVLEANPNLLEEMVKQSVKDFFQDKLS